MAVGESGEGAGVLMGAGEVHVPAAARPVAARPAPRGRLAGLAGAGLVILVIALAAAVGVTLGLVSGWAGGRVDAAIMSAVEAQLSLPYLLFAIAFMALLGSSLANLVIVLVLRSWVVYAQLVRVSVLSMKTREFVTVAVALGARGRRILFRHIAPNVIAPALVVSSFQL